MVSADTAAGEPRIGQTIRVLYGTDALDGTLDSREFTVVGTVSSSNYPYTVSFGSTTLGSGMIEQYLYAPRGAFAADAAYTEIYATVEGASAHERGSDDYEQAVTRVTDRIERNADDLAAARLDDVKRPLQQELDERSNKRRNSSTPPRNRTRGAARSPRPARSSNSGRTRPNGNSPTPKRS